jgi:SAM-dependent methyltransferase
MDQAILQQIIQWDVQNWKKAIDFWELHFEPDKKNLKCLELGGREGGLSLWLSLKGHQVICSDLENPASKATHIHDKFKDLNITYQAVNALDIPYENTFDYIAFKSIMGGVSRNGNEGNKLKMIQQIHKALKPGGKLLFAENLEASPLHRFFRKKFVKWGSDWNYLKYDEVDELFAQFSSVEYTTIGFFGTFGRREWQRSLLGRLDAILNPLIKPRYKYILVGVATK